MDVVLETFRGRVVAFSVNYRARFDDQWNEVIRYDTHHGRLHVHRFWRQEHRQVEYLEPAGIQQEDYTAALDRAEADIAAKWLEYREHLRRRL